MSMMAKTVSFLSSKPAVVLQTSVESESSCGSSSSGCTSSPLPSPVKPINTSASPTISGECPKNDEIWIKNAGKPTALDLQVREELINLVKSDNYQKLLKDKKTTKKNVYEEIAKQLVSKCFSFGDREGWKVCQQKWKNMEAETLKVLTNAGPKNSGGGAVKKPDYFYDIFDVVKDSAKACPKNLQDSLGETVTSTEEATSIGDKKEENISDPFTEEEETTEKSTSSPFVKVKTTAKPNDHHKRANNNDIIKFLQEDAARRDSQNEKVLNFLKKKAQKDDQRKKDLSDVLRALSGKKRKKQESDEESSSFNADWESN